MVVWINYHIQGLLGHAGPYGKEWYLLYALTVAVIHIQKLQKEEGFNDLPIKEKVILKPENEIAIQT